MKERKSPLVSRNKEQCSACLPDVSCEDAYTGGYRILKIASTGRTEFVEADVRDCNADQERKRAIEKALEEAHKADIMLIGLIGDEADHDINLGSQVGDENYEWRKV